jgi:hypothetical protein
LQNGSEETTLVRLMTDCKRDFTSLLFLFKEDEYRDTGTGIFTKILRKNFRDTVNCDVFKTGSFAHLSMAAFLKNMGIRDLRSRLEPLVSQSP